MYAEIEDGDDQTGASKTQNNTRRSPARAREPSTAGDNAAAVRKGAAITDRIQMLEAQKESKRLGK